MSNQTAPIWAPETAAALQSPPYSIEDERQLLMAGMIDPELLPEILPHLSPKLFYSPACRAVCQAILTLNTTGQPIDIASVPQAVHNLRIESSELARWAEDCFPSLWGSYLNNVKKNACKRKLLTVIHKAHEAIYANSDNEDVIAELVNDLVLMQENADTGGFEPISRAVNEGIKAIERAMGGDTGVPTGFIDLDARFGGIQPGELVLVAGRPGMGKTALVQAIGINAAKRGFPVAFVSAEMPAGQLGVRIISNETGIENRDLRRGRINGADLNRIVETRTRISNLPILFLDSDRSWTSLQTKIRSLKLQQPNLSLVVIDYIGLLETPSERERYRELGIVSGEAKKLAMNLNLGVVLASQLNRAAEQRDNKRPQLSDLRESGNLEQDADRVILLFRPSYYDQKSKPRELTYADMAKNRNGATGNIKLRFEERTVSFSDWVESPAPRSRYEAPGAV